MSKKKTPPILFMTIDESVTLDSIVGQDKAVEKVRDLSLIMKEKDHFQKWKVRCPKALAFTGPPGCGKTEAIRALANEANYPIVPLSIEEITGTLYGEAILKLSNFKTGIEALAEEYKHIIILIDEAESFFANRSGTNVHSIDKQIVTFFLKWIDGLYQMGNITFVAVSNLWNEVDPALKRAGRFEEIPFEPLTQPDLWKLFNLQVKIREARMDFKVFGEIEEIIFPAGYTGADVSFLILELIKDKAKKELGNTEPHTLITREEIFVFMNEFKLKKEPVRRGVGFGR